METRETILQELQQISPAVANLGRQNPYSLPLNYFEGFAAAVLERISAENPSFGPASAPFSVPAGYFENLAADILDKARAQEVQSVPDELNEIAPLLNTISKKPVYTVPGGYFESLEVTIPLKIGQPAAKVIGMSKTRKIIQYAVAACTVGMLAIGGWFYSERQSAATDTAMAIPYDSAIQMDVSQELSQVNEQEIDQYLSEAPAVGYAISPSSPDDIEVDQYIKSTSDEEINQYLQETADPGDKIKGS